MLGVSKPTEQITVY